MDESTRRHLFEPFFTTKKDSKNSGLGMAIVFGIVSHGGGRIDVQSRPGEGTAVRICLPRIQTLANEEPRTRHAEPSTRGMSVVLVVEDRHDVRTLTCGMVERLGYRALGAACGTDAIATVRQHSGAVPLLLTDVVMPGMNGRELAELLRQSYPQLKVIFMSGYTDQVLSETGRLDPSIVYLQKPFTLAQLGEVLRRVESLP
jgi:CheY-like chemotaxis protein